MQRLTFLTLLTLFMPTTGFAQSDLKKIGQFLQGIQQLQQQQQNNQPPNQQGAPQPYKVDPNSSGNQNTGGFNRPGFFQPQQGNIYPQNQYPPQQSYPQSQNYPQSGSQTYPQTYPQQGNTIYQSQPRPVPAPQKTYSNQPITIRCDSEAIGTCNYELITAKNTVFPYQMVAGQSQSLTENTDWALRYKPTPTSGYKTYRLRGGKTYEIRMTNSSWQLYMTQ